MQDDPGDAGARARSRPESGLRTIALKHNPFRRARLSAPVSRRASSRTTISRRSIETSHEWIVQRTGIEAAPHRGRRRDDVGSRHQGRARRALADAGLEAGDIDLIVCATSTPDYTFPSTATHDPGGPRHQPRRRLRPPGGLHGLRLRRCDRRQVPDLRLAQARARHRRRDLLAHPRLERPHHLRAVRRRRRRRRARGAARARARPPIAAFSPRICAPTAATATSSTSTAGRARPRPRASCRWRAGRSSGSRSAWSRTSSGMPSRRPARPPTTSTGSCRTRPTGASSPRAPTSSASRRRRSSSPSTEHGNTSAASIPLALDVARRDGRIKRGRPRDDRGHGRRLHLGQRPRPLVDGRPPATRAAARTQCLLRYQVLTASRALHSVQGPDRSIRQRERNAGGR